jgi:hypothetical protein
VADHARAAADVAFLDRPDFAPVDRGEHMLWLSRESH